MTNEVAEELFANWAARVEAGEPVEFAEFVREHVAEAGTLRRLHEDWERFAPLLGLAVPGATAGEHGIELRALSGDVDDEVDLPSQELIDRLGIYTSNQGRYRFRSVIGRGGGGVVLKVWDDKLKRPLAMKVVLGRTRGPRDSDAPRIDGRTLSRFVDEARIASQLNHPGIVPVHELGADPSGRAFFTMKLVKGEDLSLVFQHVKTGHDGWNESGVVGVLLKVCEAMAFAHDKGVIHRDLKPANVMVGRYGEVHVMDWGLARVLGEPDRCDLRIQSPAGGPRSAILTEREASRGRSADSPLVTMDGSVIGTPCYMSPEQAHGDVGSMGVRSDVYAVGAMIYHVLAGHPPYVLPDSRLDDFGVLQAVKQGPPAPIGELASKSPPELLAICEKAMARPIGERYANMTALAADLRAFLAGRVVASYETGPWAEARKWMKRNRAHAITLAGLLLMFATVGVMASGFAVSFKQSNADLQDFAEASQRATALAEQRGQEAREHAAAAEEARRIAARERATAVAAQRSAEAEAYLANLVNADREFLADEPSLVSRWLEAADPKWRGWEWRHLAARSDATLRTYAGHDAGVNALALSGDGALLVTGSDDLTAYAFDVATGVPKLRFSEHEHPVVSVSISHDSLLAITASSSEAWVWSLVTGDKVHEFAAESGELRVARFSPDGSTIAIASSDGKVRLFDATRWEEKRNWNAHGRSGISDLCFSPDSAWIVTASADATAKVWSAADGALVSTFDEHGSAVLTVSCVRSQDRTLVASTAKRSPVWIWDAATGEGETSFDDDFDDVKAATFRSDGKQVLAVGDKTLILFDRDAGVRVRRHFRGSMSPVTAAEFSTDGKRFYASAADGMALAWMARAPASAWSLAARVAMSCVDIWHVDGARIVLPSSTRAAEVWDLSLGRRLLLLGSGHERTSSASFTPDGSQIVTRDQDDGGTLWDAETGARLQCFVPPRDMRGLRNATRTNASFSFSPYGLLLACPGDGNSAEVWDRVSGTRLMTLDGHLGGITDVQFSPDGASILTASDDGTAIEWDASTGTPCRVLRGHTDSIWSAFFSQNGARIATFGRDRTIRVWEAESGWMLDEVTAEISPRNAFAGPETDCGGQRETSVAVLSPDGSRLLLKSSSDRWVVRDVTRRRDVCSFRVRDLDFDSAAFSPDNTRIVAAGGELVYVLDAVAGRELVRLRGHRAAVSSCAFSPDGAWLVTSSTDGELHLWDSVLERERAVRYGRELDLEEQLVDFVTQLHASTDDVPARVTICCDPKLSSAQKTAALALLTDFASRDDAQRAPIDADDAMKLPENPRDPRVVALLAKARQQFSDSPSDPWVLQALGLALFKFADYDGAVAALQQSETLARLRDGCGDAAHKPMMPRNWQLLTLAHFRAHRDDEARSAFEVLRNLVNSKHLDHPACLRIFRAAAITTGFDERGKK